MPTSPISLEPLSTSIELIAGVCLVTLVAMTVVVAVVLNQLSVLYTHALPGHICSISILEFNLYCH